jgi:transposase InsO family protein
MSNYTDYLRQLYYTPGNQGALSGPEKLYQAVKEDGKYRISRAKIRQFLNNEDAYSLLKPTRQTFPRSRVIVNTIDSMWDGDLADVSNISSHNDGFKFLLVLIDIFSRYLFILPLKSKQHQSIINGLKLIFQRGRKPTTLRTDKGSEFKNRWFKAFLKQENVNILYTQNETKANYAERVIRTMKNMMYRYFLKNRTYQYTDILQDLVKTYNNRPHRMLGGFSPASVNKNNAGEVRYTSYLTRKKKSTDKKITVQKTSLKNVKRKNKNPYNLKKGDTVRITEIKHPFKRDYQQKWTEEYFKVSQRYLRDGIPVYKLRDLTDDLIDGTFYQSELQKVIKPEDNLYRVEKVLKKRRRGRTKEVFVKWAGWPNKFNSWVSENSLEKIK